MRRVWIWAVVTLLLAGAFRPALARQPAVKPAKTEAPRRLSLEVKPWKGDFDQMVERRMIRVLVPYSRSLYFNDKGRERGLTAELVRDFERHINQKFRKRLAKRPITVYIIPTTRDELLSDVAAGLGDIAAGNLTITEDRLTVVDFVRVVGETAVSELVVTGPKSPRIASMDDLAGKTVHVRKASSYYKSLEHLNVRLKAEGQPEAKLVLVPDALEDEDMLEMLNAGIIQIIVVDDWKAKMWAQILPKIAVRQDLVLRSGGKIGWAIRKDSPKLVEALTEFHGAFVKKHGVLRSRMAQAYKRIKQIQDPTGTEEWRRFEETLALFRKYGEKYNFDPLMLAAQGYQESQLKQEARSPAGAVGVMQLLPSTGAEMKVGDILVTDPNIHAGAKYMDQLMSRYFPDATFTEAVRPLFAFASYNAGPGNISRMRKEASRRGLDPDKWFNNVELVVAQKIGAETTTYVRNIYKYYTAYKLQVELHEEQRKAREQVAPSKS